MIQSSDDTTMYNVGMEFCRRNCGKGSPFRITFLKAREKDIKYTNIFTVFVSYLQYDTAIKNNIHCSKRS